MRPERHPFTSTHPRPTHWRRLLGELSRLAEHRAELHRHSERDWASATFAGTRHSITLGFGGETGVAAAERFIAALPDHEFSLPGQLVADAAIVSVDQRVLPRPELVLTCELLLLADA